MDAERIYVYAVVPALADLDLSEFTGVRGRSGDEPLPLETIREGGLAAIVNGYSGGRVRPDRRNLGAHNALVRRLMDSGAPYLPFAFGMLAPDRDYVRDMLRGNARELVESLERLDGKVEMGLKVRLTVRNVFEHFVATYPELAHARDLVARQPGGPTADDKIELGRMFEGFLEDARRRHRETIERALGPIVVEFAEDALRDEGMVSNLACLIDRRDESTFEQLLLRAAAMFDDDYSFDYSGPWPPYHFVRVAIHAPNHADV